MVQPLEAVQQRFYQAFPRPSQVASTLESAITISRDLFPGGYFMGTTPDRAEAILRDNYGILSGTGASDQPYSILGDVTRILSIGSLISSLKGESQFIEFNGLTLAVSVDSSARRNTGSTVIVKEVSVSPDDDQHRVSSARSAVKLATAKLNFNGVGIYTPRSFQDSH